MCRKTIEQENRGEKKITSKGGKHLSMEVVTRKGGQTNAAGD